MNAASWELVCEVTADDFLPAETVSAVVPVATPPPPPEPLRLQVHQRVVVAYNGQIGGAEVTFRADSFLSVMLKLDSRMEPYADRMPVLFDPSTGHYFDILEEKSVQIRPI